MALGGCIVDSGNFDWEAHKEKFPGLTTPDESYQWCYLHTEIREKSLYSESGSTADARYGFLPVSDECISDQCRPGNIAPESTATL